MKIYADVLIIGGGVIGSSICYYLSKKGINTILVEKSNISAGASGSCDGFVFLQSKKDPDLIKLTKESLKIFETLADELAYDIEFEKCGGLVIYTENKNKDSKSNLINLNKSTNPDNLNNLDYLNNLNNNYEKIKVKRIGMIDLHKIEPFISPDVIEADLCEDEGQVNPINLNFGFAGAAKKKGAKILTFEEVTSFKVKNSDMVKKINKIYTSSGKEIVAKEVVCACGAWSAELGNRLGLNIPVIPRKGNLVVTEVLPKAINHVILDYDYLCCKFDGGLENGFTIEQTKSGNLIIGSTREFAGFDSSIDIDKLAKVLVRAGKIFPFIKEVNIIRMFTGFRPYSYDGLPLLGKVPDFENFWLASGHEGDGIALSPITGQLMAAIIGEKINSGKILDNFLSINLARFNPGRINSNNSNL
jgi:sarcosine oxidase subunit beta